MAGDSGGTYAPLAKALQERMANGAELEARLRAKDEGMAAFMEWHRGWFIKRARPVEVTS